MLDSWTGFLLALVFDNTLLQERNSMKGYISNYYNFPLFETAYIKNDFSDLLFNETSLEKAERYANDNGFMLGSAFRSDVTLNDNMINHNQLIKRIYNNKLEFFVIDGSWRDSECNCISSELVVLVPYKYWIMTAEAFLEFGQDWAKTYEQNALLIQYSKSKSEQLYVLNDNGIINTMDGKMKFNEIQNIYSAIKWGEVKGQSYQFEGIQIPCSGWGSQIMSHDRYLW